MEALESGVSFFVADLLTLVSDIGVMFPAVAGGFRAVATTDLGGTDNLLLGGLADLSSPDS